MKASISNKAAISVLVLILAFSILFSSCVKGEVDEEITAEYTETTQAAIPEGVLTVPYTSLDSINPFLCSSVLNSAVTDLVFRSLYKLDGGFNAIRDVANSENITDSAVKVEIPDNLVFSDATPVTASDIVYSFNKAKTSPLWKTSLDGIEKCTAEGTYSVSFTLDEPDVNVLNLLTFPIAKQGTADSNSSLPTGSGYYKYEKDELRIYLTCNLRFAGDLPEIGTVRLYDINDASSLMHLLDTGVIDCFYTDLSEGTAKRTYSSVNEVYLNNLVFIGLNHESYLLSIGDVRCAVSKALDRRALAENAFLNHARPTVYPFNMSWSAITDSPYIDDGCTDSDILGAEELLNSAGGNLNYNLTLICREDNSFLKNTATLIVDQLSLVNINVTLQILPEKEFEQALEDGEYDMYLGEIKLTKNMDLSPFFSESGSVNYGFDLETMTVDDLYYRYKSGEIELEEFITAFDSVMPFIPLLYRNGQFCYSRNIGGVTDVTENAVFSSISGWKLQ